MLTEFKLIKQFSLSIILSSVFIHSALCNNLISKGDLQLLKEKSFTISKGNKLLVDLSSGDVKVTYWDKEEVNVKIFCNENAKGKMSFSMEKTDEMVKVTGKRKSSFSSWFSNMNVEVEIKVPAQFNLDISTAGGDIKCGGITGKAELNSSGGDIWADKFSGIINVSTSGGNIFLFCRDAQIDAETSGGDVTLEYEGENKGIELSTSGGDIEVKVPKEFTASMELSTSGGDVSCSLNMSNVKKSSGSRLVGDLNGGGQKLSAHTSGGDITVSER